MPEVIDPNEQESRQSLYRDLLSHLNTTIWGSPSIQDNLNPIKTLGETFSELTYRPSEEELKSNSIEFGPEGKALPKTIAGKLSRFTRKLALDPLYSGANALDRAYKGQASMQDAAESALTALSGGTFGSGGSAVANVGPGWQSRTLDWLAGRLGKAPKQATVESWISKAKGAGLPTEERDLFARTLEGIGYKAKDRVGAERIAYELENQGLGAGKNLPTQGIETKILSEEAAKRYTKLSDAIESSLIKTTKRLKGLEQTPTLAEIRSKGVDAATAKRIDEEDRIFEMRELLREKQRKLVDKVEQYQPRWSQYNLDEVTSPREILYKAKGSTYKNPDIETHYPGQLGEGLQWHQREGKLMFPEGQSTHMGEQQSDLVSEWVHDQKYLKEIRGFREANPEAGLKPESAYAPKPTLHENWYKTGFRDLVNRAVKEDSKFISWDSAAIQKKRWPAGEGTDKFFDTHYDQKLVNFVKKEYGVTPEKIELGKPRGIKDYQTGKAIPKNELKIVEGVAGDSRNYQIVNKNESEVFNVFNSREQAENFIEYMYKNIDPKDSKKVWRIPITDEMKRKVLLEGQYFSKKDEDNAFRRPYEIG